MKNTFLVLFVLYGFASSLFADESKTCSAINYCRVEKKTWRKNDWHSDYIKEANFASFCSMDRPALQLEPELGIELWLFNGDKTENNSFKSKPYVHVNLYTYKLTYVVASGSAPLDGSVISFSHRLTPKGKTFIDVTCFKK
jgi:hypothetical protein